MNLEESDQQATGGLATGGANVNSAPAAAGGDIPMDGCSQDEVTYEVTSCIMRTVARAYKAIYYVWLEDYSYVCFREELEGPLPIAGQRGSAAEDFSRFIEHFVDPEDRQKVTDFVDYRTVMERLGQADSIACDYRVLGLGWQRCQFLVSRRDENGQPSHAVFAVTDISAERTLLAKEQVASFASRHDMLTGALNRMAFEEATAAGLYAEAPIGFALVDVDSFKTLNDEYGHGFGDTVLAKVAEVMTATFRSDDLVFRMGGDEFAIVLKGCKPTHWGTICEKLEHIHRSLTFVLPDGGDVTLSVGLCFGPAGYKDWMFDMADKGLYHSKAHGRAGCTLVKQDGTVADTWRDEDASIRPLASLAGANSGTGRLEFPHDKSQKPRLFCGEALKKLYGIPDGLSPEERFAFWRAGIDDSSLYEIDRFREEAIGRENVECAFLWGREGEKPFMVRAAGMGRAEDDANVIYGINRSLEGSFIIQREDRAKQVVEAQNRAYDCSYLVDLDKRTLTSMKQSSIAQAVEVDGLDVNDSLVALANATVTERHLERVNAFLDVDTLEQRLGGENSISCEFISTNGLGWCRGTWFPVTHDKQGNLTCALFVSSSIDHAKQAEMERERDYARLLELHYEAVESKGGTQILALSLFDRVTGKGQKWTRGSDFAMTDAVDYSSLVQQDASFVAPEERQRFVDSLALEQVVAAVDRTGRYEVTEKLYPLAGGVRYVTYRFAAHSHDPKLLFAVVEDSTEVNQYQGRTAKDLYDNVPGGLVSYEWYNGTLTVLQESHSYRERFGEAPFASVDILGNDRGRLHPDDVEEFRDKVIKAIYHNHEAHHVYRIRVGAEQGYVWVKADAIAEEAEDGRLLVYAMFSDVSEMMETKNALDATIRSLEAARKSASEVFENRLNSLRSSDPSAFSTGVFNLTKGMVLDSYIVEDVLPEEGIPDNYDAVLGQVAQGIKDPNSRQEYLRMFSRQNLLDCAAAGNMRVSMDCLYQVEPNHTEWMEMSVELVVNPVNSEVDAIAFAKVVTDLRLSNMLIHRSLKGSFNSVSILLDQGAEYYLFDAMRTCVCEHHVNYWSYLGVVLRAVCSPSEYARIAPLLTQDVVLAQLAAGETPRIAFDGGFYGHHGRLEITFFRDDQQEGVIYAVMRDITDDALLEKLRRSSRHDALTDLYNRNAAFERCERLLREHPDQTFAMAKLNVRRFRLYNSFFGEAAGDELLCEVARQMRQMLEPYPVSAFGRMEADVFCAFFPLNEEKLVSDLQKAEREFEAYSDEFPPEPSIGVYVVDDTSLPVEGMFARASSAAKEGGTRITEHARLYNEVLERKLDDEIFVAGEMQVALDQGQFVTYLQPKFDLQTGRGAGAEALVRWIHPKHGVISPGVFIPVFESNGFISSLDRYMWEQVCKLLRRWIDEGRDVRPISVNVSRVSAYSPSTAGFLKDLVRHYQIDPALLELELTESAYIEGPEEIKRGMCELQAAGFRILMDDFGTGYSSLNTLRNLPVDVLKLDMGFLSDTCDDARGRAVVESVLAMTKRLDLPVIAEGVENSRQASFLRNAGCEYVQGYYFARPMPVSEYEQMS